MDSLDFADLGKSAITREVLGEARGGSVVSMHPGHTGTVEVLAAVSDGLRRRGLRAVTVAELVRT
ncbi:hypothetical protein AB0C69_34295 [Actinomadura sp. NPDC048032]|uniref:hypothetical protein n=1 Tax=Actinomadura sp. NPDC048032 TaxID=3155747 RepID=UPI0033D0FEDF